MKINMRKDFASRSEPTTKDNTDKDRKERRSSKDSFTILTHQFVGTDEECDSLPEKTKSAPR